MICEGGKDISDPAVFIVALAGLNQGSIPGVRYCAGAQTATGLGRRLGTLVQMRRINDKANIGG
jgi:hypothetical protein